MNAEDLAPQTRPEGGILARLATSIRKVEWTPKLRALLVTAVARDAVLGPRALTYRVLDLGKRRTLVGDQRNDKCHAATLALVVVYPEEGPRWICASRFL